MRLFTYDYGKVLLTIAIIINSLDYLGLCDEIIYDSLCPNRSWFRESSQ